MKNKIEILVLIFCMLFSTGCSLSESIYYGEIPKKFIINSKGEKIENPEYKRYVKYWGVPKKDKNGNLINESAPKKVILDRNDNIKFAE